MARVFRRLDGGGGSIVELCLFLMMIGSAILSAFAILRRPGGRAPDKQESLPL